MGFLFGFSWPSIELTSVFRFFHMKLFIEKTHIVFNSLYSRNKTGWCITLIKWNGIGHVLTGTTDLVTNFLANDEIAFKSFRYPRCILQRISSCESKILFRRKHFSQASKLKSDIKLAILSRMVTLGFVFINWLNTFNIKWISLKITLFIWCLIFFFKGP